LEKRINPNVKAYENQKRALKNGGFNKKLIREGKERLLAKNYPAIKAS